MTATGRSVDPRPACPDLVEERAFDRNLPQLVEVVWQNWSIGKTNEELREELNALVQMDPDQLHKQILALVDEIAGHEPQIVRQAVAAYLQCIPQKMRAAFARDKDPAGLSIPTGLTLTDAKDLVPLLPTLLQLRTGDFSQSSDSNAKAPLPPRLLVLEGSKKGVAYPVRQGHNVIGRKKDEPVDIDLTEQELSNNNTVSRKHAVVTCDAGAIVVEDLGSSNGTYVNRHRLKPGSVCPVGIDDLIIVGAVKLLVVK